MLCEAMRRIAIVAEEGLEPLAASPLQHHELLQQADQLGAESGAIRLRILLDPDLAQLIEAWPTLPPAIREAILTMLRAAE